ncbi:DNA-binding GntR family transcriptional regulator [Kineococcus xinjiangensis]|uniref:DNA-binding GntR family transcriptional regulator n=1 Tax=Kineococcus xinjiangensis TaxID=512762 RepID=A0A2S6IKF2_9ACTN|nr:GntR family transcriptional regulator [Kineococcus xinjiangensis]PPK94656.1 DNA-binding GntR family transcriptional regulator [Kineococcus xinjiangensis]
MRASDRAYQRLREEILDGLLAPRTVLAEVEQAARLGVSRTPVREAFGRLVADGLLAAQSGRGLVVTELSAGGVHELYELRTALEDQAARLAAQRRDPRVFEDLARRFAAAGDLVHLGEEGLHRYYELTDDLDAAIDEAVRNSYLADALRAARTHLVRIRRLARHDPGRLREAAAEHLLIVEAIAAGDAGLAAHATHVHLHKSKTHFVRLVERHLDETSNAPSATVATTGA